MNAEPERLRVLVVDDNSGIHKDFMRILSSLASTDDPLDEIERELFGAAPVARQQPKTRFEVDCAHQGEQAIELVRQALLERRPYAVAFVDVRMPPGLDGIKTIAKLWELDPRIQAVVCTAYSDHSWNEIVDSLGHGDRLLVLKKPFDAIEALQMTFALGQKWLLSEQVRHCRKPIATSKTRSCSDSEPKTSSDTWLRTIP